MVPFPLLQSERSSLMTAVSKFLCLAVCVQLLSSCGCDHGASEAVRWGAEKHRLVHVIDRARSSQSVSGSDLDAESLRDILNEVPSEYTMAVVLAKDARCMKGECIILYDKLSAGEVASSVPVVLEVLPIAFPDDRDGDITVLVAFSDLSTKLHGMTSKELQKLLSADPRTFRDYLLDIDRAGASSN